MSEELKKMTTEELINAYIDDELSPRHKTELKRLMKHDAEFADKVHSMLRQRQLFAELPAEKAPTHLLTDIKASIERRALLDDYQVKNDDFSGTRHLFARHFASTAAVLALVGMLGYIVWKVIAPVNVAVDSPPMVAKVQQDVLSTEKIEASLRKPVGFSETKSVRLFSRVPLTESAAIDAVSPISATLRMFVSDSVTANNIVSQAVYNNSLIDSTTIKREAGKTVYTINASQSQIIALFRDTGSLWKDVDATQFSLSGVEFGSGVTVDHVTKQQFLDVFTQPNPAKRELFCKDIAQANRVIAQLPGKSISKELERKGSFAPEVMTPVLTSTNSHSKRLSKEKVTKNVNLVLTVSEF